MDAIEIAIEDYDICRQQMESTDTQFWRCSYIRSTFVVMEAAIDLLRQKAMEITCSKKEEYNLTRIELLGNSEYRILRTGRLEMNNRKAPFLNYLAFILRCLAEESGGSIDGHISLDGWRKLGDSVKVRDRLTHPKKDTTMDVSDDEISAGRISESCKISSKRSGGCRF